MTQQTLQFIYYYRIKASTENEKQGWLMDSAHGKLSFFCIKF